MFLARVMGPVVMPVQHPWLAARTLLSLRPVHPDGTPSGRADVVGVDRAQAGVGDLVLVLQEGNSARQLVHDDEAPVRTLVVGVVDAVDVHSSDSTEAAS